MPSFQITLHKKDRALLESIRNYFNGDGSIFKDKKDSIKYRRASVNDLSIIMLDFYKYPLISLVFFYIAPSASLGAAKNKQTISYSKKRFN